MSLDIYIILQLKGDNLKKNGYFFQINGILIIIASNNLRKWRCLYRRLKKWNA